LLATLPAWAACDGSNGQGGKTGEKNGTEPRKSQGPKLKEALLADFNLQQPMETRRQALDTLIARWPESRLALPGVLEITSLDDENRASIAVGLARLGMPLVEPLLSFVAAAPSSERKLLTAGAIAYNLVHPFGLVRRSPSQRHEIRKALQPLFQHLWLLFVSKETHDQAMFMGLCVFGPRTIDRLLKGPFPPGTVTRVALAIYLMLTGEPEQSIFDEEERLSLRRMAAPLARVLIAAILAEPVEDKEEQPMSLRAGLEVLGEAAVKAMLDEPRLRTPSGCAHTIDVLFNLPTHSGAPSALPGAALLAHCTARARDEESAGQGALALGKLGAPGIEAARRELSEATKAFGAPKAPSLQGTWYVTLAKQPGAAAMHPELAALFDAAKRARDVTHQRGALEAIRSLPPDARAALVKSHPALGALIDQPGSKP
jgi:hypothetical protein